MHSQEETVKHNCCRQSIWERHIVPERKMLKTAASPRLICSTKQIHKYIRKHNTSPSLSHYLLGFQVHTPISPAFKSILSYCNPVRVSSRLYEHKQTYTAQYPILKDYLIFFRRYKLNRESDLPPSPPPLGVLCFFFISPIESL